MSGVTKHIYDRDIQDICTMWNNQLKTIQNILPQEYRTLDIIELLEYYYPHEWKSVEIKYQYYCIKDKSIKKHKGKSRFNMMKPQKLLEQVPLYKKIMSQKYIECYSSSFDEKIVEMNKSVLLNKRKPKIEKIDRKIEKAMIKTQSVTPSFLAELIGLYERKNTSQKDKMYIIIELQKYYSPKILMFFYKINDIELNKQLRMIAFKHLQSFNYQPRARRQKYMLIPTKNKNRKKYLKEVYPNQTYYIPQNPNELEYRIKNAIEQKIKVFDYFISHSSKDSTAVQKIVTFQNSIGKNIFCDWINDSDYLKRNLVCKATLKVIEKRLEQSKALIFVKSENSMTSVWCNYELNYFLQFNRPIFVVEKDDIEAHKYTLSKVENLWFENADYKSLALM